MVYRNGFAAKPGATFPVWASSKIVHSGRSRPEKVGELPPQAVTNVESPERKWRTSGVMGHRPRVRLIGLRSAGVLTEHRAGLAPDRPRTASVGIEAVQRGETMRTEREKMLAGELYDPLDPALVLARDRARDLCRALNATREAEVEERRRLLRGLFGAGGDSVGMQPPFYCDYGTNIRLGERVFFNFNCVVLDVCEVRVGDFTLFGPSVQIYTATHPMDATLRRSREFGKPIAIGSDVWVGGAAVLCPGVTIGSRTVIGAGSVVTRDVPEGVLAAGNPCRVIRALSD